jgi:beta-glucanase (GH16 family)
VTSNRTHRRAGVVAVVFASILVLGSAGAWAQLDYQLVWSDEFDGNEVDPAKWEFQIGNGCPDLCGWGNNELQYYRVENATVADGRLTITAKEEDFAGYDYTSARMRTVGLGDWTYGRIEMRARMPIGQGLWPAFWMLPTDWVYGGWAASGEIDTVEYLGHAPDELLSAIHYGGPWPENASWASTFQLPGGAPTFHEEFHDFALEWTPNELRWYVDGSQVACQSHWYSTAAEYPAPFDQDMHLLLNMAVGGDLPGAPDPTTEFPQDYVIEHVRVLQRPEFPQCETLFDGMDHANPFGNGWFAFDGEANGGIGASTVDLSTEGCNASLGVGWGSGEPPGYFGGFGRTFPVDLSERTHFTLWINPDAGQEFTIEVNLQEDDDGDDAIPGTPDGADDEFQFDCTIGPVGPCAVAGGGWQRVSIPLESFYDDNSYHYGGNGVFDPVPTGAGGNGRLVNVVFVLISHTGGNVTFRTDKWQFTREEGSIAGRVWSDDDGDGAQGAGEPGLGGVVVDLLDSASSAVESTTTDGNGEFQFEARPSDGYTVAIDSSSLPAGASPTTDPDGLATPHAAELVLGCADSSSANDFGYSQAPSPIPPNFTVAKDPADVEQIVVGYDTSTCYAPDHAVLFGLLGDFTTVTAADCSIGNSGSATIPSPAGNVWLLVVGHDGTRYSSAGQSTAGERSLQDVPAQCPALASQDVSASCP